MLSFAAIVSFHPSHTTKFYALITLDASGKKLRRFLTTPVQQCEPKVVYPNYGQPMADNTEQFHWIVTIQGGLDTLYLELVAYFGIE